MLGQIALYATIIYFVLKQKWIRTIISGVGDTQKDAALSLTIKHCHAIIDAFKMIEVTLESLPQLVLQCWIVVTFEMYTQDNDLFKPSSTLQLLSICVSSILTIRCITNWLLRYRNMWIDPTHQSWASKLPIFLWLFSIILFLPYMALNVGGAGDTVEHWNVILIGVMESPIFLLFDWIIILIPQDGLCWRVARSIIHVLLHVLGFGFYVSPSLSLFFILSL